MAAIAASPSIINPATIHGAENKLFGPSIVMLSF
jgi:hypothetical protein